MLSIQRYILLSIERLDSMNLILNDLIVWVFFVGILSSAQVYLKGKPVLSNSQNKICYSFSIKGKPDRIIMRTNNKIIYERDKDV